MIKPLNYYISKITLADQNDLKYFFLSMQDFECNEEFRRDIDLDSIKEKLRLLESDITKTEYSIVIAGKTVHMS